jgi:2,4-dienoyl-CoA reductase-like NADH-dependent reductase (Old Yellow Enzyme family)
MNGMFSPLKVKDLTLKNRIAVSPMCQYSAHEGEMTDWHLVHLGGRAAGGAALVIAEAAAVSRDARATPEDLGLWNDAQAASCERTISFIKSCGAVPGVQLQHAGRMAGMQSPWNGNSHYPAGHQHAWQPVGPSPITIGGAYPRPPREMSIDDIKQTQRDFAAAAARARDAGFEWLELHFGHTYLMQNFFSPISNRRTDAYGGSFEGRARMLIETLAAVRADWPERLPLSIRLGVRDFHPGEQPLEESVELIRRFKAGGIDLIDVTLGLNCSRADEQANIPWGEEAFLAETAAHIRAQTNILTATSWNIRNPQHADNLIREGKLDMLMLGRPMLADPYWPYHAAQQLAMEKPQQLLPVQYSVWLHDRENIAPAKANK